MQERKPPAGHGRRGGLTARSCSPPCPRFLRPFEQRFRRFPCWHPYCTCCERLGGVRLPRGGENTASLIRGAATTQERPIIKFQQGCSLVHPEKKALFVLGGAPAAWSRRDMGDAHRRAASGGVRAEQGHVRVRSALTCVTTASSSDEGGSDSGCH